MRRKTAFILVFIFVSCCIFTVPAYACHDTDTGTCTGVFTDFPADHWAYSSVMIMKDQGAISGYPDGSFRPESAVSRAEFAKMMVAVLDLHLRDVNVQTFRDVSEGNLLHPYVETAKYYLTGFRTNNGDYFKPEQAAVREDIAVAICKAKNLDENEVSSSILNRFKDNDEISPNLVNWVALAVHEGIMQGTVDRYGNANFAPQQSLTRAEAAVLLSRLINSGEKVTYSAEAIEKVTYGSEPESESAPAANAVNTANVSGSVQGDAVLLNWNSVYTSGFKYYKVVISKYDSAPSYPDDGYMFCITDVNQTTARIIGSNKYNGGDFGGYLIPGERYYFSITAVYNDVKNPGNAVQLTFPD